VVARAESSIWTHRRSHLVFGGKGGEGNRSADIKGFVWEKVLKNNVLLIVDAEAGKRDLVCQEGGRERAKRK